MAELLQIFFSPAKVFDRVRERGIWFPALLAITICAGLGAYMLVSSIGIETIFRKQMESNPQRAQQMTPEQMATVASSPLVKGVSYVLPIVIAPLTMLVVATCFMTGLTMTGSKLRFSRVIGATSYAWFPYSLLTTLMLILILQISPNKEDLNLKNPIATNAGAFLDPTTTNKTLYSFASSIDLLSFGLIAFLSYGLSRVSGRSFGSCATIVVVLWIVYVVGKSGMAAMF